MALYARRSTHYTDEREPPPPPVDYVGKVYLRHPEDPTFGLLQFDAVDDGQVLHRVVLDACYVLSGNRKGYLSRQSNGEAPQDASQPFLLPGSYYYHVETPAGGHNSHWTIITSFNEWQFPHEEFVSVLSEPSEFHLEETFYLRHWRSFQITEEERSPRCNGRSEIMSNAVKSRDSDTCVLSALKGWHGLQNSYLIPGTEEGQDWFRRNKMFNYSRTPPRTMTSMADSPNNGVTLRSDLHACLDAAVWFIYPVRDQGQYGAYFYWGGEEPATMQIYHAIPLRLHRTTSEAFLFARFAYNVFRRLSGTVRAPRKKRSRQGQVTTSGSFSGGSAETGDLPQTPPVAGNKLASEHSGMHADPVPQHESEAQRLMYLRWKYSAAHPEIDAIADPSQVSTSEREWRQLLDSDEVEQYYT